MKALEEKICREGKVYPGNVLKVGSFLNHQIDVPFMQQIGEEFHRLFQDERITKVLTIETSGIPIACMTAVCFDVPVLFAKKHQTKNLSDDCYCTEIQSFTHGNTYQARIEKQYLNENDVVLIIDDFLANGCALEGLMDLIKQAGAKCVGCGTELFEKCCFNFGRNALLFLDKLCLGKNFSVFYYGRKYLLTDHFDHGVAFNGDDRNVVFGHYLTS